MSNPGPTKEEYASLIYMLATLESELGQARKLLEAPAKTSLWRWLWGMRGKALMAGMLLLCVLGTGVWGRSGKVSAYFSGNKYLQQTEAVKIGYVSGVADAFSLIGVSGINVTLFSSHTNPMNSAQVCAIVDNYMKAHPKEWHTAMAGLVYGAVIETFAGQK